MRVVTYDPFVSAERVRERGAELAETIVEARRRRRLGDAPPAGDGRDAPRRRRRAAREDAAWRARSSTPPAASWSTPWRSPTRSTSGHVAGAALDVFESEPITESPLFERLRRRRHAAPRRLDGRGAGPGRHDHRRAGRPRPHRRAVRERRQRARREPGRPGRARGLHPAGREARPRRGGAGRRRHRAARDHVRGRHRPARHAPARRSPCCAAPCAAWTEDDANLVNARALAQARGIDVRELRREAGDFTNLSASPRPTTPRWPARCSAPTTARGWCAPAATRSRSSSPG